MGRYKRGMKSERARVFIMGTMLVLGCVAAAMALLEIAPFFRITAE